MFWWVFWLVVAAFVMGGGGASWRSADVPGAGDATERRGFFEQPESDFDYCVRKTPGYRSSICNGESKQVREKQRRDLDIEEPSQ
jgi:hypothetical protein